jgi:hypothetical protein
MIAGHGNVISIDARYYPIAADCITAAFHFKHLAEKLAYFEVIFIFASYLTGLAALTTVSINIKAHLFAHNITLSIISSAHLIS